MPAPKAQAKGKGKESAAKAKPEPKIPGSITITTTTTISPPQPLAKPATKKRVASEQRKTTGSSSTSTTTPAEKKQRRTIPLSLKAEFIKDYLSGSALDPQLSASSVGRWDKYQFNSVDVTRILAAKEEILAKVENLGPRNAQKISRMYPRKMEVIEEAVFDMFKREIDANIPVNDSRMQEVALEVYMHMAWRFDPKVVAANSFRFSNGWLARFKTSRGIRMQTGHGEEGEVDMIANAPKFATIASLLLRFKPSDIYNCDETGLYLKVLSNRTLSHRKVFGRKMCKEARVSILLCCNADGSHKLIPFVLSKNRPNGLTAETLASLRCHFKNGYMNTGIFNDWLLELDDAMGREGRRIALLMDNAPGHGKEDGEGAIVLKNIELIRLPPKTTSVAQPLDAGIIRSFKVNYSRNMIRVVSDFRRTRSGGQPHLPYGRLWACLAPAWDAVSSTTIRNCFAHVPTIPHKMKEVLRTPVFDEKDRDIERLQEELMALYPERAAAIAGQKDFGVLTYLKGCEGQGPTRDVTDSIKKVMANERFKHFFLPNAMDDSDDDDEEEEESSDYDYDEESSHEVSPILRTYRLRAGERDTTMVPSLPSSQESGDVPLANTNEAVLEKLRDAAARAMAMYQHCTSHAEATGTVAASAPIIRASSHIAHQLDLLGDMLFFEKGEDEDESVIELFE